jgi:hypothetical protein
MSTYILIVHETWLFRHTLYAIKISISFFVTLNFYNMHSTPYFFRLAIFSTALIVTLLAGQNLNAQSTSKARYNSATKVLSLDESSAFGYQYHLDISAMGFASKEKADLFFSGLTTELVSYQVNFDKKDAAVLLNVRSKPDWKAKEWNTYLATLPKL